MPCARGSRAEIEAAKIRHAKDKAHRQSPEWKFWERLVKTEPGDMSPEEYQYFAVNCVQGEVHNGGFDQYFWNSSGNDYEVAVAGMTAMGAERSLDLLVRAKTILFGSDYFPDRTERWTALKRFEGDEETEQALNALDKLFYDSAEDLHGLIAAFARKNGFYSGA
jgi:hypothetical protein